MKPKEYAFHEFAEIFPLLPDPDLKDLAADIKQKGLQNDIVLYEGKILDGRNRFRACQLAAVRPTFTHYASDDPVGYVISLNSKRRHMTKSEIAIAATKATAIMERLKDEARERKANLHGKNPDGTPNISDKETIPYEKSGQSTDQLGELMGVSGRTIRNAMWLKDNAPEEFKKVECGSKAVGAAVKDARAAAKEKPVAPPPEPEKPKPTPRYKPAEGLNIWTAAKGLLDNILPNDVHREEALNLCIEYCNNRKSKGI
jgi:hypothetical protein